MNQKMKLMLQKWKIVAGLLGLLAVADCQAFMLNKTRVVLSQTSGVAEVQVVGTSTDPLYLIQSRVYNDQKSTSPANNFMVSPPLFRMETGGRGVARIVLKNPAGLPTDRESVFYLRVSGIPSTNPLGRNNKEGYASSKMILATGSMIKLFYRPRGLPAPSKDLMKQVSFSKIPGGLLVRNTSPYHINFLAIIAGRQFASMPAKSESLMLSPFSQQVYGLKGTGAGTKVEWRVLDDSGLTLSGSSPINNR